MLTREENELLTEPVLALPWRAVPPILDRRLGPRKFQARMFPRSRGLAGEKLIAFRDTDGRIGLLERYCAHRGADLYYGRNEENGLRCIYHGWKFDIDGKCLEVPNATVPAAFMEKCKLRSYPVQERGHDLDLYGPEGSDA